VEVQVLSSASEPPAKGVSRFRENGWAVVVLFPIVLGAAFYLLAKSRQRGLGQQGRRWFCAWVGAGALFTFSLLAGLSIGLFLLPVATFAMFWLALRAPYWREVAGFLVGGALFLAGVALFA
jgi:hypothetical protein